MWRTVKALLPEYETAIEFTWLVNGITIDDVLAVNDPDPLTRARKRAALKERDHRKWEVLCGEYFNIDRRAWAALAQPNGKLQIKAELLRVNGAKVTRHLLAAALGVSPSTLDRKYDHDAIKRACDGRPVRDEEPVENRFPGKWHLNAATLWQRDFST